MSTRTPIIVGGLLFGLIVVVGVPRYVELIETDIAQRTARALRGRGIGARVAVDGRDVVLLGRVDDRTTRGRVESVVRKVWGVRALVSRLELLAGAESRVPSKLVSADPPRASVAQPLQVDADLRSDRTLTLIGAAPSDAAKQSWLAEALTLYPNSRIRDRISVRRPVAGVSVLEAAVVEGLIALSELEEGRLTATESRIIVSGKVRDDGTERRIAQRLRSSLPRGYLIAVDVYVSRKKVAGQLGRDVGGDAGAEGEVEVAAAVAGRAIVAASPVQSEDAPARADTVGQPQCRRGESAECGLGLARLDVR